MASRCALDGFDQLSRDVVDGHTDQAVKVGACAQIRLGVRRSSMTDSRLIRGGARPT
jgi:hypothetical protein